MVMIEYNDDAVLNCDFEIGTGRYLIVNVL